MQHTITQLVQEIFACVGERLQLVEAKKSAGTFDRVHVAEDAGQPRGRARIGLQFDKLGIDAIEVLVALDQEFLDQIIHGTPRDKFSCAAIHVASNRFIGRMVEFLERVTTAGEGTSGMGCRMSLYMTDLFVSRRITVPVR